MRVLLLLTVLLSACTFEGTPYFLKGDFVFHEYVEPPKDISIPKALWDEMEKAPVISTKKTAAAAEEGEDPSAYESLDANMRIKRLMRVTLYLKEKTSGVLGGHNHKIQFEPGGGHIDLADFVQSEIGTYHLGFEFEYPDEINHLQMYFVSHSRYRKLQGETLGSGCSRFAEITEYVKQVQQDEGIKVNATQRRDLSLLAGSFVFVLPREDGLYLAQVAIYDRRHPGFHCAMSPVHLL